MICLLIEVDGRSREIDLPADPAERDDMLAALTGGDFALRETIDRGLDLWMGIGQHDSPANAPASALAADLSGESWRHYHGPVVVCGVELSEAGEEHAVDLTGDQLAALRWRLGRHGAD
ncbi:hypothetical protein GT755_38035 [Herbidospora sp. NEAU-GS84]|uniref:DUF3846 domain-containing protein n=1 Tax=Herbidospora solisilvae TaxID=2696284 RepID=A0A7C9NK45_9ACTN|nr:hypothetical protein [Herbidospora solisilvae]NAS27455.1 hypothetical protein [Herbidospora solisilvae]